MIIDSLWFSSRDRAVSPLVGFIIVFGLAVVSVSATVALGQGAIADTQGQLSVERAEQTMTQLDSQATHVALGRSDVQSIDTDAGAGGYQIDDSAGHITVDVNGDIVLDREMGALTYENGKTTLAYQGGGVWKRHDDSGATMVSPPEFHYRDETLTLPLVVVKGESVVRDRVYLDRGTRTRHYPSADADNYNPVSSGTVTVTVQSEYARAWGRYFETRTDGSVSYYPDQNKVEMELVVPTNNPEVEGALVGQSPGVMDFKGQTDIDAYDSSEAGAPSYTDDVDVYIRGDAELKSGVQINGSLHAGGDVTNKGTVKETVYHGGSYEEKAGGSAGDHEPGPTLSNPTNINRMISEASYSNSDTHAETIADIESGNCPKHTSGDWCVLDDTDGGTYELSQIDLGSEQGLKLDTNGNTINIKVRSGGIEMESDAMIKVVDGGRVNIYNAGDADLKSQATVFNDGHDSRQFWLYMRDGSETWLRSGTEYTGVVYAPGQGGGGEIRVKSNGEIWGALVGDVNDMKADREFHYDKALQSVEPIPDDGTTVRVTYLHVSTNEVEVSD